MKAERRRSEAGSEKSSKDEEARARQIRERLLARFDATKEVWERLAPTVVARERSEKMKEQAAAITRRRQLEIIDNVVGKEESAGSARSGNRLLPRGLSREDLTQLLWQSVKVGDLELFVGCLAELRALCTVDTFSLKRKGDTLLHLASFHAVEDIVHYILEHAASLEEEFGERQADSLTSSRSAGADPAADSAGGLAPLPADLYAVANAIDTPYNRVTPLMEAVRGPLTSLAARTRTIDHLLAAGADVTARNARGDSVLHVATQSGVYRVLRHLVLRARACAFALQLRNARGETPLQIALRREREVRHAAMVSGLAQRVRRQRQGSGAGARKGAAQPGARAAGPVQDLAEEEVRDYLAGVAPTRGGAGQGSGGAGTSVSGATAGDGDDLPTEPLSRAHGEALRSARLLQDLGRGCALRRRLHAMSHCADTAWQALEEEADAVAIGAAVAADEAMHGARACFARAEEQRAADEAAFAEERQRSAREAFEAWLGGEEGAAALRGAVAARESSMLAEASENGGAGALLTRDQHARAVAMAREDVAHQRLAEARARAVDAFRAQHRDVIRWGEGPGTARCGV